MDPLLQRALDIANRQRPLRQVSEQLSTDNMSEEIICEPAHRDARPVYWQRATGEIVGPAKPEFLAKVAEGPKSSFWVVAQFQGQPIWINSAVLRSRQAFETQVRPTVMERIREPR
jgi:hypothetical protein